MDVAGDDDHALEGRQRGQEGLERGGSSLDPPRLAVDAGGPAAEDVEESGLLDLLLDKGMPEHWRGRDENGHGSGRIAALAELAVDLGRAARLAWAPEVGLGNARRVRVSRTMMVWLAVFTA